MDVKKDITTLGLDSENINILNKNKIYTVEDVWGQKRSDLKKMGITDSIINHISIKLQLLGLDLNKKVYKIKK